MKKSADVKTIVILGPTSSGKSELAVELAQKFHGEIISADSRQIYQDMNLGTGKVEGTWQPDKDGILKFIYKKIPHHLIDFISPKKEYNVSHFQQDYKKISKEIQKRSHLPILCGGTGFWINAATDKITLPHVLPDKELRLELSRLSKEALFDRLQKLDPARASTIDCDNPARLIRAIEIATTLGKVPLLKDNQIYPANDNVLLIGIDIPIDILEKKIRTRLDERFAAGMVEEVKNLKEKHKLNWEKIQSFGLAYYWIPLYLQNKISLEELKQRVYFAERQYAKKQKTWFKRDPRIVWIDYQSPFENTAMLVKNFFEK